MPKVLPTEEEILKDYEAIYGKGNVSVSNLIYHPDIDLQTVDIDIDIDIDIINPKAMCSGMIIEEH